jgi:hypothetical protein
MSSIPLLLMVLAIGLAAYVQARRAGTWSWKRFGLTVALLAALGSGAGFVGVITGRGIGRDHPLLVALSVVLIIGAGVTGLALWWRRR